MATETRWVVKIGSSLLTNDGKGLDHKALARWVDEIAGLQRVGMEVVVVSSGAVAEGMSRLGWRKRPDDLPSLQAAAAVGQMGLMQAYEASFRRNGICAAQVLLTHEDFATRQRYLNVHATLRKLAQMRATPGVALSASSGTGWRGAHPVGDGRTMRGERYFISHLL
jgi:glutamate 5-kinase